MKFGTENFWKIQISLLIRPIPLYTSFNFINAREYYNTCTEKISLVRNEIQYQPEKNMPHVPPFGEILELQIIIANFHIRIEIFLFILFKIRNNAGDF